MLSGVFKVEEEGGGRGGRGAEGVVGAAAVVAVAVVGTRRRGTENGRLLNKVAR